MKSVITIGRSSQCDIIIPNEKISREHARISVVGGRYVYEDVGKNGTVIGGRVIHGERITVAPGTEILLAGRVPLPWSQVYAMMPVGGARPFEGETSYQPIAGGSQPVRDYVPVKEESMPVGWGILAFIIPVAGFIMYFVWKDEHPKWASTAATIAGISFGLNLLGFIAAVS